MLCFCPVSESQHEQVFGWESDDSARVGPTAGLQRAYSFLELGLQLPLGSRPSPPAAVLAKFRPPAARGAWPRSGQAVQHTARGAWPRAALAPQQPSWPNSAPQQPTKKERPAAACAAECVVA